MRLQEKPTVAVQNPKQDTGRARSWCWEQIMRGTYQNMVGIWAVQIGCVKERNATGQSLLYDRYAVGLRTKDRV